MVVEVQVQDTSHGLSGDLAWVAAANSAPIALSQSGVSGNAAHWGVSPVITLPATVSSTTKMRLRVSEIDYYPYRDSGVPSAPITIDTNLRRPFVALIPLN